jgi:hypothetical protein
MTLGNVARIAAVLAACAAALGSATSRSSNQSAQQPPPPPSQSQDGQPLGSPPQAQPMEPGMALGLWRSTFGAVKIEPDSGKGGIQSGALQGVWVYQRQGQEVIGYFAGQLRGNVLQFRWQEPNDPPLTGEGYLVFDVQGRQYNGRWWSDRRDRVGDWNGWRQGAPGPASAQGGGGNAAGNAGGDPYGGQERQPSPYGGQERQPSPYGGQDGGSYAAPPRPAPTPAPAPAPRTYY